MSGGSSPLDRIGEALRAALLREKQARAESAGLVAASREPIAILGMACRTPGGVVDPEGYWALLAEGRDAVGPFPDRWDAEALYDPDPEAPGKSLAREGGFLDDIAGFDAAFFGISPREAQGMDPQQRLVLEAAWEALERAGLAPTALSGSSAGVYLGSMGTDYGASFAELDAFDGYAGTGRASSVLAGRLAYVLGLQGPAMTVDTACSSSLVALHLAAAGLRRGECDLALAGGVQVMCTPATFVEFSRLRGLAPDGRCKSFAAEADGAGWAEGVGMLVLKRLSDAQRDGDPVLAVIRGSAVNQDGRSQGLTAPNGPSQQRVIRRALEASGLSPEDIDAVEAHGTGTRLGDPIEAGALAAVYGPARAADRPLWLGSAKSNLGHTQSAAGALGLIKMVLAMRHALLPKTLHAEHPSPHIAWEGSGLRLLQEAQAWTRRPGQPRRAGVSSFGVSGTNAHVVLEEAPEVQATVVVREEEAPAWPILISGHSEQGLRAQADRWAAWLAENPDASLHSVARTAALHRSLLPRRAAVVAADPAGAAEALRALAEDRPDPRVVRGADLPAGPLVGLFTGQGSQRPQMGRALAAAWPAFDAALRAVCAALDPHLPRPLLEVMWAEEGSEDAALLDRTDFTQPALFALELALFRLWQQLGIRPDVLIGHSIGELAAACCAEALSLEDAARLVAARGRLMAALPEGGAMIALAVTEEELAPALAGCAGRAEIAAINGPSAVVVSGEEAAVLAIAARFADREQRRLKVSHAFHSPAMEPMGADFAAVAASVTWRPPKIPLISGETGRMLTADALADPETWTRQLRRAVRFRDAVATAEAAGARAWLEIGPQGQLSALAAACVTQPAVFVPSLRRDRPEPQALALALGALAAAGAEIHWHALLGPGPRAELPTTAFVRQRFWLETPASRANLADAGLAAAGHPLLGAVARLAEGDGLLFTGRLSLKDQPWLADHAVFDTVILPGTAVLELALAAAEAVGAAGLADLSLEAPLRLPPRGAVQIQLRVEDADGRGDRALSLHSRPEEGGAQAPWTRHATGLLSDSISSDVEFDRDLAVWPPPGAAQVALAGLYPALAARGLRYGPAFQGLSELWRRGETLLARVALPEALRGRAQDYRLHPALLDAALRPLAAVVDLDTDPVTLPFAWTDVALHAVGAAELRVRLERSGVGEAEERTQITIADAAGQPVAQIGALRARPATAEQIQAALRTETRDLFSLDWVPVALGEDQPLTTSLVLGGDGRLAAALGLEAVPDLRALLAQETAPGRLLIDLTDLAAPGEGPLLTGSAGRTRETEGFRERDGAGQGAQSQTDQPEGQKMTIPLPRSGRGWIAEGEPGEGPLPNQDMLPAAQACRETARLLALLQALLAEPRFAQTALLWITRGAVFTGAELTPGGDLARAPLWGLIRAARAEQPERLLRLIDLDAPAALSPAALAADAEPELALRHGVALAARLAIAGADKPVSSPQFNEDATILITGGTGELGQALARQLARRGARHLILSSRRGAQAPGAEPLVQALKAAGAGSVTLAACDVADEAALAALLHAIPADRPLKAVFHLAGLLDDGMLGALTPERLDRVLRPKIQGAWNLHRLTEGMDLAAFVLFSSAAGVLGSAGQASYAAANCFLDALAAWRRARGLPGQSLAWGLWEQQGFGMTAALSTADLTRMKRQGVQQLTVEEGLALLDAAAARPEALLVPVRLDLAQVQRASNAVPALFKGLLRPARRRVGPAAAQATALRQRLAALDEPARQAAVLDLVQAEIAGVLGLAGPAAVPAERPLKELGLDSLMAVELRNRLAAVAETTLPATLAFDYPTPLALRDLLLRQAFAELTRPEAVQRAARPHDREPIAIIGMACRTPGGVVDPEGFWALLEAGRDAVGPFPDRWDAEALYDPDPEAPGKSLAREGGFLDDIAGFDAAFFGISPREAQGMDPQQRLVLETAWEALERAGLAPTALSGSSAGVYLGSMGTDYGASFAELDAFDGYAGTGRASSVLAGRLAYVLGLQGPAMTVDTACSSSLVALHLAAAGLRRGECDLALAGGVQVMCTPATFVEFSRLRGLAPDGRCKSFAAEADGAGWAEGVGMLVLKRLSDAQRDGDPVLAVIRGSAVNQDGRSQGLTAPNGPSQQRVIRRALESAGLGPDALDAVEAHGTGTRLGDPIEAGALAAVYGPARAADRPLWLGSAKSNLGHTQAAAGALGLIKMVLAMRHALLPKTLHAEHPSPHIAWEGSGLRLLQEAQAWTRRPGQPRRAGVSSFGVSGTNAHVVLEEAPEVQATVVVREEEAPAWPILISGHSEAGLRAQADRWAAWLAENPAVPLSAVARTAALHRSLLPRRAAVVAADPAGAAEALRALAEDRPDPRVVRGADLPAGPLVGLFTGQGSQRPQMGRALAAAWPAFDAALRAVCAALDPHLPRPLLEVMWAEEGSEDAALLDRTDFTQPALFALELALFRLWQQLGIRPDVLIGHSIGELAAACCAEALSLEDAARLVAARGRLMAALPEGGAMIALAVTEEELAPALAGCAGRAEIAAINGPSAVVVSGEEAAVLAIAARFADREQRRLKVSHAFHSPAMEPMGADFAAVAASVTWRPPKIPLISGETGRMLTADALADPETWTRQLRRAVRFRDAVATAEAAGARAWLEIGPQGQLSALAAACVTQPAVFVPSLRRDRPEPQALALALGALAAQGLPLPWPTLLGPGPRAALPTTAFVRQRFWQEAAPARANLADAGLTAAGHPLLSAVASLAGGDGLLFTGRLSLKDQPWLADHAVYDAVILPGTGVVEMALAAAEAVGAAGVADLSLEAPLVLPPRGAVQIQLRVEDRDARGDRALSLYSRPEAGGGLASWTRHARGTLSDSISFDLKSDTDLTVWPPPGAAQVALAGLYPALAARGLRYGPAFQGLSELWRRGETLLARVALPEALRDRAQDYRLHPALLDAALRPLAAVVDLDTDPVTLPFAWTDVALHAVGAAELRVRLERSGVGEAEERTQITIADAAGQPVAQIGALRARPATAEQIQAALRTETRDLFSLDWVPVALGEDQPLTTSLVLGGDGRLAAALGLEAVPDLRALLAQETAPGRLLIDLTDLAAPGEGPLPTGSAGRTRETEGIRASDGAGQGAQSQTGQPEGQEMTIPLPRSGRGWIAEGEPGEGPLPNQDTLPAAQACRETARLLALLQALLAEPRFAQTALLWITRGAVFTGAEPNAGADLARAPLWGLVRAARAEQPERLLRLIDLDAPAALSPAALAADAEPELALRHGVALAARLRPAEQTAALVPPDDPNWELDLPARGSLADLRLAAASHGLAPLQPGQVRVAVRAAGVNFRDALNALGLVPAPWLGLELAGVVTEVAEGVAHLPVGAAVLGLGEATFASQAIADARVLTPIPAGLSFAEAATVPLVFLTALYGLQDLAGLQAGERVLVHAAAGGVGMAAVQLAQQRGAIVYATASPGKWGALRAMGVDAGRIASSRDLHFADAFLAETGGQGVQVVLNALAGDSVQASLRLLPRGGRFLEMGKTDLRDKAAVEAAHPGVRYLPFDLMEAGPDRVQALLRQLCALFEAGALAPLPLVAADLRQAPAVFKHLANGRNVGKLLLLPPRPWDGAGTALITGGTGELGQALARQLARRGAPHLILSSRRGAQAPGAEPLVQALKAAGAGSVTLAACDVADEAALAALLHAIPADRPLKAVFHLAGLLDDGMLGALNPERLDRVLRPKIQGAWNLHRLTEGMDLAAFVLFSSAAGVLGSAGQASYAAANCFLDALAAWRRARGLPGQSLAWGLWEQQGFGMTAALSTADLTRMKRQGVQQLTVEEGLALLDAAAARPEALLVPVRLDLAQVQRASNAVPALFKGLLRPARRRVGPAAAQATALRQRLAALDEPARQAAVLDLVQAEIAGVLGLAGPAAVPAERPLKELGLDSLMAVELRNRLAAVAETTLPATLAFDYPTPLALRDLLLRQAFAERTRPEAAQRAARPHDREPIAILGMACRTPGGVVDPEGFWALLEAGRDAVGPFPDRWDAEALYDPDPEAPGKSLAREGGFLDDIAGFDAAFFGISPREAQGMDPQQRLVLETAWEALERAGLAPTALSGSSAGVYLGASGADYGLDSLGLASLDGYAMTGRASSVLAGRLAYVLGLQGPAMTVDTACSSSLVALHLAAAGLRQGECDLALAGGVQVMCTPITFVEFSRLRGLAPDGRCKSFAAEADGAGWAEGVGMLVLKRLSDAQRDGDPVLAVIRGSAVNQDGRSQGLTAPNGPSQQRVIRAALESAGLGPDALDAVEAHGTGTRLGDPIEAGALAEVFGPTRTEDHPLWLGSSKSNLGHTQSAAGALGLIKMVLAMRHALLPKTLHAEHPSPHIAWEGSGLRLLQEAQAWTRRGGQPRRAGVSSFGVSGTNAHVVLEEAPEVQATVVVREEEARAWPILISGHSEQGLRAQADRWAAWLAENPDASLHSVARTAALHRSLLPHRAALLARSGEEAVELLSNLAADQAHPRLIRDQARPQGRRVFVFPGQGGQWPAMGRALLAESPVFAQALDACDAALRPLTGWSVRAVLAGEDSAPALDAVDVVQPALWAMAVGLAALWRSLGVIPDFVVGHSQGEIAAAVVAGALSREDGARIVALRSRLVRRLAGTGAMASVELPADVLEARLAGRTADLGVAVVNGPGSAVIAGDPRDLDALLAELEAEGVFARRINVDYASHCSHVLPLLPELRAALRDLKPRDAEIPFLSTVTGDELPGAALDADYWCRNLAEPVRLDRALETLAKRGATVFVEQSPHPVLSLALSAATETSRGMVVGSLRRDEGGLDRVLLGLGALAAAGAEIHWHALLRPGPRADLPTTAFVRQRYWLETPASRANLADAGLAAAGHPLLGAVARLAEGDGLLFTGRLSLKDQPWLADHAVFDTVILPGTAVLELALTAAEAVGAAGLADLSLEAPLRLPPRGAVQIQLRVEDADGRGDRALSLHSRPEEGGAQAPWTRHATGLLSDSISSGVEFDNDLAVWPPPGAAQVALAGLYPALAARGLRYGPAFQGLLELWRQGETLLARVALPEALRDRAQDYKLHPALLDAALHAIAAGMGPDTAPVALPFAWTDVALHAVGAAELRVKLERPAVGQAEQPIQLTVADGAGQPVARIGALRARPATAEQIQAALRTETRDLFSLDWVPVALGEDQAPRSTRVLGGDGRLAAALGLEAVPDLRALLAQETAPGRLLIDLTDLAAPGEGPLLTGSAGRTHETEGIRASDGAGQGAQSQTGQPEGQEMTIPLPRSGRGWIAEGEPGEGPLPNQDTLPAAQACRETARLLALLQALLAAPRFAQTALLWITRGAVFTGPDPTLPADLARAPLWGLIRAARAEHPERLLRLIDLDAPAALSPAALAADAEPELALRRGVALAPRLAIAGADKPVSSPQFNEDATILITGGTGELGQALARQLARRGAPHLILSSRRGAQAPGAESLVQALKAAGAGSVTLAACDVADEAALAALLHAIPADRPLNAVFHLAGLLDDGMLGALNPERLDRVLRPKIQGAWNLHRLTEGMDLAAFVLFSSAAGVLGSAGQASYAAANCFLDALAAWRRARGLPGQSLAWGLWEQQGFGMTAALSTADLTRMKRQGVQQLTVEEGLALLDAAAARPEALLVPVRLDLAQVQRASNTVPALFKGLLRPARRRVGPAAAQATALRQRLAALDEPARQAAVLDLVQAEIAGVLGLAGPAAVPAERPLKELGLDSLMAVELRNRLAAVAETTLPATLAFDYPTPLALRDLLLRQAFAELARPEAVQRAARPHDREPIAIIGMACRTPGGVVDPEGFWALLEAGRDAVGPFPDRWDAEALYDPDPEAPGKSLAREGGFLDDIAGFDAAFFGISPREAQGMDPQQRLVLETAWEALERAGLAPTALSGSSAGVYLGSMGTDYGASFAELDAFDGYAGTGRAGSVLAGRLAYVLGLQGPAMTVDTACSSSLVALHLAAAALRQGECDLALAGGVQVMCTPITFVEFSRLRGMAPDGRCKSFAAEADGAGWAEGVGMLVLKRLSDAQRDGDPVLAVIRGSAVNQDGRSQGLTAPNGPSQQRVIRAALESAGLGPDALDAVEAHGTGTRLGDPIEAGALAEVFGPTRTEDHPLWLGSSKSNLGHTQSAAGALGLIKMVLAMRHALLPKTLHAEHPSPHIAWEGSGLRLLQEAQAWTRRGGQPRRAGVSSFGVSGTNAHVVLEEAPEVQATVVVREEEARAWPILISGHSEAGLRAQADRWAAWLAEHPDASLHSVARTAALHRSLLPHRAALLARSGEEAVELLSNLAADQAHPRLIRDQARPQGRRVFVFPGQGGQWPAMGRALLAESPVFAQALDACDAALRPLTGWSVRAVLAGEDSAPALDAVDVVQPALWAMAVGLAALWRSLGVIPDFVVGHSQGEIAAAVVAGALSREDGARIVALRSRLVRRLAGTGAMASVELPADVLEARLAARPGDLRVAVVNGPGSAVIAGDPRDLDALLAELEAEGVFARRINVDYASHCSHVLPLLPELRAALRDLKPRAGDIPFLSTVTGDELPGAALDADYWCRNLAEPVRLDRALDTLAKRGATVFVEQSPHPVLSLALSAATEPSRGVVVGSLRRDEGGLDRVLLGLGALAAAGAEIHWHALLGPGPRADLPTTAFVRQRYWLDRAPEQAPRPLARPTGRLLGPRLDSPLLQFASLLRWEALSGFAAPEGRGGAGALLALALEAAEALRPGQPHAVRAVSLLDPLVLAPGEARRVQVLLLPTAAGEARLSVFAAAEDAAGWARVLEAEVVAADAPPVLEPPPRFDEEPPTSLWRSGDTHAIRVGLRPGAAGEGWFRLALWNGGAPEAHLLHPALLPSLAMAAAEIAGAPLPRPPALHGWSRAWGAAPLADELSAWLTRCARSPGEPDEVAFDARLFDRQGRLLAQIDGIRARCVAPGPTEQGSAQDLDRVLDEVFQQVTPAHIAALGAHEDLYAAGLDSLMALSVFTELSRRLRLEISIADWARTFAGKGVFRRAELAGWLRAAGDPVPVAPTRTEAWQPSRTRPAAAPRRLGPRYADLFPGQPLEATLWEDAAGTALETIRLGAGGPLAVFLPPLGCELCAWAPVMGRVARERPVLALNFPGYGQSPRRPDLHGVAALAEAVLSLLRAVSPDRPVDLVGWSLGGFVAQVIAARAPEAVRTLSLLCTTNRVMEPGWRPADLEVSTLRLQSDLQRGLARLEQEARIAAEALIFRGRPRDRVLSTQALSSVVTTFDQVGQGAAIQAPTLIVAGEEDLPVPLYHARRLQAEIAGARLVVIPEAGHYAPLLQPEAVLQQLLQHLRDCT